MLPQHNIQHLKSLLVLAQKVTKTYFPDLIDFFKKIGDYTIVNAHSNSNGMSRNNKKEEERTDYSSKPF